MPSRRLLPAILALTWATVVASNPPEPGATEPKPGDAGNFFRAPDFAAPAVSPDGTRVAFIARQKGHARLFMLDLASGKVAGVFDPGDGEVDRFWWLGSQRLLIAGRGEFGYEYFAQDLDGHQPRKVTTLQDVVPDWITTLPRDPVHVIARKFLHRMYLTSIDVTADRGRQIDSTIYDPNLAIVSATGELRAKCYQDRDHWRVMWRSSENAPWHDLVGHSAEPTFVPLAMAPDDHHLVVIAHDQGDTSAVMSLDPDTGKRTLLAQRPDRDVWRLVMKEPVHAAVGVSFFHPGHDDREYFDQEAGDLQVRLARSLPETYKLVENSSADGALQVIEAWDSNSPSRYYLFDKTHARISKLGQQFADDALPPLGSVRFFEFATRDGIRESGYILLPHSSRAAQPFALLLVPMEYAGEEGRVANVFNGSEQYLASRGLAVARVVVRGARGLGKIFRTAGDFQMAETITHDYEDALKYLESEGFVDRDRVAIVGRERSALFALRIASLSNAFKAVVARDPAAFGLTALDVDWISGRGGDTYATIQQAGGTSAAYKLIHDFEPERFIGSLSAQVLVICSSWYDSDGMGSGILRDSLRRHHKPYEWYLFDLHDIEHRPEWYYETVLNTKIGDYLVKALGVTTPEAPPGK